MTAHAQQQAAAAHRIMSLLGARDVLAQLCREGALLLGSSGAFASYASSDQQWSDGLHVVYEREACTATSAAELSALYALHRRVCLEQRSLFWPRTGTGDDAVLTVLAPSPRHGICAFPISARGGRVGGILALAALEDVNDEKRAALSFLCDCAASGLDNAFKFAAAKRDQDRLFHFAAATDEAIWDWSVERRQVWWSGGIQKILGGSGLEVAPTLDWKLLRVHHEDRDRVRASFERALLALDSTWSDVFRFERADGSFATVEDRAFLLRDAAGNVYRALGHLRDVTELDAALIERKRAQDKLATERAVFRKVFMNAPACICVLRGPEHVFELANPPYREMVGGRELEGLPVAKAMPELRAFGYFEVLDRVYQTGTPFWGTEMPAQIMQKDGSSKRVFFNFVYQPMLDPDGKPEGIIAFGNDVTEQVLARRRLQAAHRLVETITANATLGLLMMDADHHCTFMNPAAEKITGYRFAEVQGKTLHDMIHHSRPDGTPYPREECPIDRALPAKNQEHGEDVFIHKDGHFYPVAFTASPILERGRATGTVLELRDVTQEKSAQREREKILADLRAAVAARDEFLSIASHELRTPLTALGLQLEAMQRTLDRYAAADGARDKLQRKMDVAGRQVRRLTLLIDGLLNVSRIATGRFKLDLEDFDLVSLVCEVVERFEEEAKRAHSSIKMSIPDMATGRWDRTRLDQALTNLLSNAIKYGPGKPIDVNLSISGELVALSVRDEGIGIAPEDVQRIFGQYERAVSANNYGGLGLGLYITRQIVSAHGGSIDVESQPGRGTTFTIRVARYTAQPSAPRDVERRSETLS